MKITCGRIVHYVFKGRDLSDNHKDLEGQHRPAMVVVVNGDTVDLQVFVNGTRDGFNRSDTSRWITGVKYNSEFRPGTWHWPEQV